MISILSRLSPQEGYPAQAIHNGQLTDLQPRTGICGLKEDGDDGEL